MQTQHLNRRHPNIGPAVITALLIACGSALAGDPAAPAAPNTNTWITTAAAAVALTRGNSENFLTTLSLDTKRKWEKDELALGVSGGYGESTVNNVNSKNTEFVQGFGQFNYLFTEKFYGGLRLDGQYDGIAGVDYRFRITPLAGYYFIKNDKMTLAAEAGPSEVFEKLKGASAHTYTAIRFAERFDYKLTDSTKVWQNFSYSPQIDDWSKNYLLTFEAGIDTAITKKLSLRVVFQDMYASQPAPGKKQNDMRLLAGAAYKF
jgi:putative salt-induced outer membrane protein YdiY